MFQLFWLEKAVKCRIITSIATLVSSAPSPTPYPWLEQLLVRLPVEQLSSDTTADFWLLSADYRLSDFSPVPSQAPLHILLLFSFPSFFFPSFLIVASFGYYVEFAFAIARRISCRGFPRLVNNSLQEPTVLMFCSFSFLQMTYSILLHIGSRQLHLSVILN